MEPKVTEGVCLPVYGYEEDFLDFVEEPVKLVGVTRLVRDAGGEPTDWSVNRVTPTNLTGSSTNSRKSSSYP